MEITNGPFAGVSPAEDEIRTIHDRSGQPIVRDGVVLRTWGVHQRTPYFLDKFSPIEGWGVEVSHESGGFDLPDPELWVADGNGGPRMGTNPTVLFTARLVSPHGRVLGSASYLKLINSITSHQEGETVARGKLYDAMGLLGSSGSFGASEVDPVPVATRQEPLGAPHVPVAIPTTDSSYSKLLPVAQALIEEHANTSAPAGTVDEVADESASDVPAEPASPAVDTSSGNPTEADVTTLVANVAPAITAAPAAVTPTTHATNGDLLNANLLRQAENRARLQGILLPVFTDSEHLRSFYRDLCTKRQAH